MIPLVDLKAQYRALKPEIDAAIARVLESAQFVLGPAVESFERDFASYCGTTTAVAVNSGTSALHVALLAAGVRPGDEVITVPFTFVATVAAIEYAGAKPVFVDVDPDYYTMDPSALERAITPRTRAVVPVHLFGQPADMDPIAEIARRHRLAVIEDACQAHGAEYKGRRAGCLGDIGCFSFYPGKNLGAYGEGGAAVTGHPPYADQMRLLRSWGEQTRYEHLIRGFNYRMDGIQGAVLGVKLKHLERWTEARRRLAAAYGRLLAGTATSTPRERPGARHVYQVYAVRLPQRDRWRARLHEMGIQTGVHYPVPVHLQPAYRDLGYTVGDFPVAEAVAREVLSLPMFPEMTDAQIEEVSGVLRAGLPSGAAALS
ncbi:MAG: DegT/DnrJ/EryC1/StrS family aminotransferase [Acidobacteria bacterium]|nr:DegT/DnrJ/EryC1/StrS family aminotransferase [Acidobacteriota bacterium]